MFHPGHTITEQLHQTVWFLHDDTALSCLSESSSYIPTSATVVPLYLRHQGNDACLPDWPVRPHMTILEKNS